MSAAPLLPAMLMSHGCPTFSGDAVDFRDFARDFSEYLENACAASPGRATDQQCLALLGQCLDKRTQRHLRTQRDLRPDMTFEEYWSEFARLFGGDSEGLRRREWESVSLEADRELDLPAWKAFESDVVAAVTRDPHILDDEVEKKILQELPIRPVNWKEKVLGKIADKKEGCIGCASQSHAPLTRPHWKVCSMPCWESRW